MRATIRRAFRCGAKDCKPATRVFLRANEPADTVPVCPEHGPMVREHNRPYRGASTEPMGAGKAKP